MSKINKLPLSKGNEVTFQTIKQLSPVFLTLKLCKMMKVSHSAYYAWLNRPEIIITVEHLHMLPSAKVAFEQGTKSMDFRELRKQVCSGGFIVTDFGVQKTRAKLGLIVTQRVAYKVTTKPKHSDADADNLLNQNFNSVSPNQT